MKKIIFAAILLTGCATAEKATKESWDTSHLYQRLVIKTQTSKGFTMVPITTWEPYRVLDHRVGGDTLIQYCSKKL